MSTRRKWVIALNVIAILIASLSYAMHRTAIFHTKAAGPAVEMQLVPLPATVDAGCAPSCVITNRAALGITH